MGRRGVRIGRRIVRGRFVVILLILAACLIWLCVPKGAGGRVITVTAVEGSLDMETAGSAVCIWPEEVYTAPRGQKVEYHATDGQRVAEGDIIADIFPAETDSGVLDRLYALQEDISLYQISILDDTQSGDLDDLNARISEAASAVQVAAMEQDAQAVAEVESLLNALMDERQQWLDEHVAPDEHLLGLYNQEADLTQELQNEMIPIIAPADGYVSFSVDGLENRVSPDLIDYVTPADMDEWLRLTGQASSPAATGDLPFFKLILDGQWYIAVETDGAEGLYPGDSVAVHWNDGSETETAQVVRIAAGQDHDLVILRPEGSGIHKRFGYVRVVKTATGLKVPVSALYKENGGDYIAIDYNGKPAAIEIRVEALGDEYAIVSAAGDVEGLGPGAGVIVRQ